MFTHPIVHIPDSARSTRAPRNTTRKAFVAALTLVLAACSGGGGSSSQAKHGTVVIRTTSIAGTPIRGVTVSLGDSRSILTRDTDENGEARFEQVFGSYANVFFPGGGPAGYYQPDYQEIVVRANSVMDVPVTLVQRTEATPVLLAAHPVYPANGSTLTIDLDVALLDANGAPWETLTTSNFETRAGIPDPGLTGGFGGIYDSDGSSLYIQWTASVIDAAFVAAPVTPRSAIAAAVLLDQSAGMGTWDLGGLRLQAVGSYFDSIAAPDTVALGSYQGVPGSPTLTTYGEFTSDAGGLRTALAALAGQESGTNSLDVALADMIAFTAANAAAGSDGLQRAIVTVRGGWYSSPKDYSCGDLSCTQVLSAAAETALANGIAVVEIDPSDLVFTEGLSVKRTDGAVAIVDVPAQLPMVFRAMNSIIGHSLAHTRVRIALDTRDPDTWKPGRSVPIQLKIRLGAASSIICYLDVPI
jgi:hypothetical protein